MCTDCLNTKTIQVDETVTLVPVSNDVCRDWLVDAMLLIRSATALFKNMGTRPLKSRSQAEQEITRILEGSSLNVFIVTVSNKVAGLVFERINYHTVKQQNVF